MLYKPFFQCSVLLLLLLLACAATPQLRKQQRQQRSPQVIAHRGASGSLPELTLESFKLAIDEGSDAVEVDTGVTADHRVVMLHEPQLSLTTDVEQVSDFAARQRSDIIWSDEYSVNVTDWFLWNFTLAEVQEKLYKDQRMQYRDQSHNGKMRVPTLAETLQLTSSRGVMLLVEVKLCDYYSNRTQADTVELVAADIEAAGLDDRPDAVQLQAFELECCAALKRRLPKLPVYKLHKAANISDQQLRYWQEDLQLDGIGVHKAMVALGGGDPASKTFSEKYKVTGSSDLVARAHALPNFRVLVWTLRNEDRHLAWSYRQDPVNEVNLFIDANVDGLITDFPETCRRVIECNRRNSAAGAARASYLLLLLLLPLLLSLMNFLES